MYVLGNSKRRTPVLFTYEDLCNWWLLGTSLYVFRWNFVYTEEVCYTIKSWSVVAYSCCNKDCWNVLGKMLFEVIVWLISLWLNFKHYTQCAKIEFNRKSKASNKNYLGLISITVSAPIQPHSWIEPHPLSFHAKDNFFIRFYVVIWGQKCILKE